MQPIRILSSLGAMLIGLYFILLLIFLGLLLPSQGFAGDDLAFHTPAIALPFALQHPTRALYHLLDLLFSGGLVLTAITLYAQFPGLPVELVRLATAAALIGATLVLASGMLGFISTPTLAQLYAQSQPEAGAAYLALTFLTGTLQMSAIFAYGWWVLLLSAASRTGQGIPKWLAYVGLLAGISATLNFLSAALSLLTVALGLVWTMGLAVVMLRHKGPP